MDKSQDQVRAQNLRAGLLLLPSTLAAAYAFTVACFLPFFRECSYTSMLPSIFPSMTVLVATLAYVLAQPPNRTTSDAGSSTTDLAILHSKADIAVLVTTALLATLLIRKTRRDQVEGGPPPSILRSSASGSLPPLRDKVVVVTGANAGIGKETCHALASAGATVVMACRSRARAEQARRDILSRGSCNSSIITESQLPIIELDLCSLRSVRTAAAQVRREYPRIDILINNAGLMMGTQQFTDEDGLDVVMQANHVGHYLWTRSLLPNLVSRRDGVVLNVTSSTYTYASHMDVTDLCCTRGRRYSLFGQYAQSKLANILFTTELARRGYRHAYAIHPGLVRTDVTRHMPWYLRVPNVVCAAAVAALQKTPAQGAWCTVHVATLPGSDGGDGGDRVASGTYWVNREPQATWPCARDTAAALELWNETARLVDLPVEDEYSKRMDTDDID